MDKTTLLVSLVLLLLAVFSMAPAFAQEDLESKIDAAVGIDSSGKTSLLQILNGLTTDGTLDESVPKRTMQTSDGNRQTIFVFDLGSEHEASFNELLSHFRNREGYRLVNEKSKAGVNGVELYNGNTRIFLIKKDNILIEYKIDELFKKAVEATNLTTSLSSDETKGKTNWMFGLLTPVAVVALVLLAAAGFFFYRKKMSGNVHPLPKLPFHLPAAKKRQQEEKKPEGSSGGDNDDNKEFPSKKKKED